MSPVITRLSGEKSFKDIYCYGRRLHGVGLNLIYLPYRGAATKVAVVVSKKISNKAAKRNLFKRRLWSGLREHRRLLPGVGYNLVVVARPQIKELVYKELSQDLMTLLKKIGKSS